MWGRGRGAHLWIGGVRMPALDRLWDTKERGLPAEGHVGEAGLVGLGTIKLMAKVKGKNKIT